MDRKNIQRGTAALAFVVMLGLAGARPAAAAQSPSFRFLDRLASAWSLVTGGGEQALRSFRGKWKGTEKVGAGMDPNGAVISVEDEQPTKPPIAPDGQR
ncbi:MAG TPA: hypothetical protein VLE27_05920 [Thermoanaerobaculia bacterium]|nr:hypothetical protein [Thermoanaerobaculia bacterium]